MNALGASAGHTRNGLPYNKLGDGPKPLVVFDGIGFDHAPMHGLEARMQLPMYAFLSSDYTVYVVKRRKGMPPGYAVSDMSDDYAEMIGQEFGGPVDIVGNSAGGAIALQFAADHPDLVRRLVIQSAAYTDAPAGKEAITRARDCAAVRDWRGCTAVMLEAIYPPSWYKPILVRVLPSVMTLFGVPDDPSDFIVEVDAGNRFDFRDRLGEIACHTLLAVGEFDPYTPELCRETAEGIPDCKIVVYAGMGHPAKGPRFERDVLAFLRG